MKLTYTTNFREAIENSIGDNGLLSGYTDSNGTNWIVYNGEFFAKDIE